MPKSRGLWLGTQQFSVGENADSRKISGVTYSGGAITDRYVYAGNNRVYSKMVIDLKSSGKRTKELNPSLVTPGFYNHDQDQPVGHGTFTFGNNLTVEGKLSEFAPMGVQVWNMMKEGFPMQQSMYIENNDPNDIEGVDNGPIEVNGQMFDAPIAVFRNSFIREFSLCPIGADPHTNAEIFSVSDKSQESLLEILKKQKGEKTMNLEKFTWLNDAQKKEFETLHAKDPYDAFTFAQKLCPCADEAAAASAKAEEEAAAAKLAEEEKKKEDAAKSESAATKAENEKLKTQVSDLTKSVTELKKVTDKFEKLDPALFKKDENTVDADKVKAVVAKTKELMTADPSLDYTRAYTKAAQMV